MRRARPGGRGQGLVEFALALPIFLLLLFGLIDGGRLVFANNTVAQAARESARLASVQAPFIPPATCTAPVCPATAAALRTNVLAAANRMTAVIGAVPSANLYMTCTTLGSAPTGAWTGGNDCASSNGPGNVVSVRIAVPVAPITPFFGPFYPSTIFGSATMAIQ